MDEQGSTVRDFKFAPYHSIFLTFDWSGHSGEDNSYCVRQIFSSPKIDFWNIIVLWTSNLIRLNSVVMIICKRTLYKLHGCKRGPKSKRLRKRILTIFYFITRAKSGRDGKQFSEGKDNVVVATTCSLTWIDNTKYSNWTPRNCWPCGRNHWASWWLASSGVHITRSLDSTLTEPIEYCK